ncbi:MAG: hypothetical protein ACM3IG_11775 [Myxococcales bacterium]|jgi:hypothetical protein|nr:hypothetical protein [Sphingomicrobium sp.]
MVNRTAAWKRYNMRVIWFSLAYAIFLIAAVYGFKHHLLSGPAAFVAALLPALAVIGIFAAMGRYLVEEQDEYVRMLMVRQSLWASGFALSAATIWGFLQNFGLLGPIDGYWIVVAWYFGLGIGGIANKVNLGAAGC